MQLLQIAATYYYEQCYVLPGILCRGNQSAYDQNIFDSTATTCIIGIGIENWVGYCRLF